MGIVLAYCARVHEAPYVEEPPLTHPERCWMSERVTPFDSVDSYRFIMSQKV